MTYLQIEKRHFASVFWRFHSFMVALIAVNLCQGSPLWWEHVVVQSLSLHREDLEGRKQRGYGPNIPFKIMYPMTQRPHTRPQFLNVPLPPSNAENQNSRMQFFRTYRQPYYSRNKLLILMKIWVFDSYKDMSCWFSQRYRKCAMVN